MKVEDHHIADLRSIAAGHDVAYVDRIRRRYRGTKAFEANAELPVPLSPGFAARLRREGWAGLYSASSWARDLPSALSLLTATAWGFAADISNSAALWVMRRTGFAREEPSLGVLEAISADREGRPRATVRVPRPGGGWVRHGFRLVADGEVMMSLGQGIEFMPPTTRQRPRLRPISPPSAVGLSGSVKHLSVAELVGVVSAHSQSMDFAGLWERKTLPSRHMGEKCLSPRLAGLYVHQGTGDAVLVFRGTSPLSLADWVVNVGATHALTTYQHRRSVTTAHAALSMYPRLLLAGHSKGGGLAQFASHATALPAVTFNTVGLPLEKMGLSSSPPATVEHFMVRYDIVSNVSGLIRPAGMGISGPLASLMGHEQRMLGGPDSVRMLPPSRSRHRLVSLHSLESVRDSLREHPFVIPDPFSTRRPPSYALKGVVLGADPATPLVYEPAHPPLRSPRAALNRSASPKGL
jgi:hypothetical protein